ncbi:MAG: DAK2 domain-containing protein [Acidimicrobiales bacterium]
MEALGRLGAADLARVTITYHRALQAHREALNRLNVYPVPDGDTGTNMALTLEAVVKEITALEGLGSLSDAADPADLDGKGVEMAGVCKAISHGSLMGARGNSGVILSQLLRGMTGVLSSAEDFGAGELAQALASASEAAYQAVLRPVEGTILTVARAAADGAKAADTSSLLAVSEGARSAAADALERTPELLNVLAQAGVVDAGGAGYLLLVDAFLSVIDGRPLPPAPQVTAGKRTEAEVAGTGTEDSGNGQWGGGSSTDAHEDQAHPGLRYEVMYFLEAPDESVPGFKDVWEGIGDSIVVVGGDGLWNCHIHTDDVGAAIEAALDVGRPRDIRVSDLAEQIEEERWVREGAVSADGPGRQRARPAVRTAVVAVANGEGVGRIFRSLGAHHLVHGGQSMNPSTAQIVEVVDSVESDEVVILPNNENIVPVAMQACELSAKTVRVVPTGRMVEGFAALLEYDPEAGAEENAASMAASARRVVPGEVTQAVRDATGPAGPIKSGDWMGMSRDGVEVVGSSMAEATCGLLGKLLQDEHELLTLIEGEGAAGGQTRQITEWLAEHRPDLTVEVHHGGQPLYPYLLSIE